MKLLIHPPVSEARLAKIKEAAAPMEVVQPDETAALSAIADADAMFGYLTPPLLRAARSCALGARRRRAWRNIFILS